MNKIIKQAEINCGKIAIEKIDELMILQGKTDLPWKDPSEVSIFAPNYFIDFLILHLKHLTKNKIVDKESIMIWGHKVRLHPYNELVMCHIKYAENQNENLIVKIKL